MRALGFVAWAGVYHHAFKIPPALRAHPAEAAAASIGGLEAAPFTSRTLHQIDVVLHDDVDLNTADLKARIAAAAHFAPADLR